MSDGQAITAPGQSSRRCAAQRQHVATPDTAGVPRGSPSPCGPQGAATHPSRARADADPAEAGYSRRTTLSAGVGSICRPDRASPAMAVPPDRHSDGSPGRAA